MNRRVSRERLATLLSSLLAWVASGCHDLSLGPVAPEVVPPASESPPAAADPVIARITFNDDAWPSAFAPLAFPLHAEPVLTDAANHFEPIDGRALRVTLRQGDHYGIFHLGYYFAWHTGAEPEEIYFRYALRLAPDFDPGYTGKLPGIGGTYFRGGYGGIPSDGKNGWSARGLFGVKNAQGRIPIGFYVYHVDMPGQYGDGWYWNIEGGGLELDRWYQIEQYARMNTPGLNDGVLRAWVDDALVFERTDLRFRDVPELKIEKVWVDVYYGGKVTAERDHHLFMDDIVISRSRIGSSAEK